MVHGFARRTLGDGDDLSTEALAKADAVVLRDLLRREVGAVERLPDRRGDEGVQVVEVGFGAGGDGEHFEFSGPTPIRTRKSSCSPIVRLSFRNKTGTLAG